MAIPQINEQYILDAIADRVFNGTYISTQKATAVSEELAQQFHGDQNPYSAKLMKLKNILCIKEDCACKMI